MSHYAVLSSIMYDKYDFIGCYSLSVATYSLLLISIMFLKETKPKRCQNCNNIIKL